MNQQKYNDLVDDIITSHISFVTKERFDTIYRHYNSIEKLNGDIVECGIWKGGMSIFLAKLFQEKNIWMCDSFEGFQPLDAAKYDLKAKGGTERYVPGLHRLSISYDIVIRNLSRFGLRPDDRIKLLKGWVKDTLRPDNCNIKNIALLRIDVDAYSATLEVLGYLYDKVVPGGFIIFDDACLYEANHAICDFFKRRGIENKLLHPITDQAISLTEADLPTSHLYPGFWNSKETHCGSYIIKQT